MIYMQYSGEVPSELTGLFKTAAEETLVYEQAGLADMTIVLTDDAQIHELNRQYLGIDSPTDVLSFPSGDIDPDSGNLYLGDVIISYPRALDQAQSAGHSLQSELRLLTVHGVLHLLGHDHAEDVDKTRMWASQDTILLRLTEKDTTNA